MSDMEAMRQLLAAAAVLSDAALYASGARRLSVDHGGPLTIQGDQLLQRLVRQVAKTIDTMPGHNTVELLVRPTSLTWTFHRDQGPTRPLILAARTIAIQLDPGGWIITADDYTTP